MDPDRKTWELTPYEQHRTPHKLDTVGEAVSTSARFLEAELSCAICLDILRDTRTTKECLHRFCGECISQALRSGNKECPNCRSKLASMRSLRPDPLFDNIIRIVFPNRADLDKQQSMLLEKLDKNNNRKAMLSSIEAGLRHQAEKRGVVRSGRRKLLKGSSSTSDASGPSEVVIKSESETETISGPGDEVVALEVIPYKKQMKGRCQAIVSKWKRRYVKVKGSGTVAHLARFILSRLITERQTFRNDVKTEELDISCVDIYARSVKSEYQWLEPNMTLWQVRENFGRTSVRYVTLAFAITGTIPLK
ncbi:hypothetical protein RvY_03964 [Ramazzottius varieornatus]|uniref:RING-type E3 ubiquitin transferase n=1 Tax=Ramazzottius varieornatus TaxID=947166 RepID=A0A1D1UTC9_RAMVA|nr:hypothetical protein RvY_03964 [Ramazzottius varieornatus]